MKHIIVPATSANMGSGFDSVGIAFQKYNHLWYVEIDEGIQVLINPQTGAQNTYRRDKPYL